MRIHIVLIFVIGFLVSGCSFYEQFFGSSTYQGSSVLQAKLKSIAKDWKRTPYVLGGTTKKGADCSGFTQNVFTQLNKQIPRTTAQQLSSGKKISKNNLRTGDLVFFRTGRGPNAMHVGIYLSNNNFIHLSTHGGVRQVSMNESYWKKRYIGASRYDL
ncbi:MAG: C40 family peptidase [Campylobacter sp.]|nr:C40 family peptidase [Campylobacter sp.]